MKTCRTCQRELPPAGFGADRSTPDGRRQVCRSCRRAAIVQRSAPSLLQRIGRQLAAHRLRIIAARLTATRYLRRADPSRREADTAMRDVLDALDDDDPERPLTRTA